MLYGHQIEELIGMVNALDRSALIAQFHHYQSNFPVDFSSDFLADIPLEKLRHIFVAMCLQCQRLPGESVTPAA